MRMILIPVFVVVLVSLTGYTYAVTDTTSADPVIGGDPMSALTVGTTTSGSGDLLIATAPPEIPPVVPSPTPTPPAVSVPSYESAITVLGSLSDRDLLRVLVWIINKYAVVPN